MKIGFAFGNKFKGNSEYIYDSLIRNNIILDFVVFTFPSKQRLINYLNFGYFLRKFLFILDFLPIFIIRLLLHKNLPSNLSNFYVTRSINSYSFKKFIKDKNPDILIIFSCGIVSPELCTMMSNKILSSHAGKLPDYRGVSNVEWAYFNDDELYGTVQFLAPKMDSGRIVTEKKIKKIDGKTDIEEIREDAFKKTFDLFHTSIKKIKSKETFSEQEDVDRTNWYRMHPFIKSLLSEKLSKDEIR